MSPSPTAFRARVLQVCIVLAGMVCLCLVAIQPFSLSQMPHSADGALQLYRVLALEHSLRVDHPLWPRFSSSLVHGYGAPLFNFFPPLAYYPASLAHRLGLSFLDGWLLSMALYVILAGAGALLLGRLLTRSMLGGWVAAAAYVYSPYLLFDSVARGATAELAALALFPFAMYGMTRLAFYGRRRDWLIALACLTLFIPLHTLITLHGAALLACYGFFLIWRADDRRSVGIRLSLAGALALMLTAFYWLPALAERDAIKLPLIAEQLGHIDPTRHLRPLTEVLSPPQTADPTRQNQALPITLGWIQLLLAALGAALSWRGRFRSYRALMLALWLAVACLVFLNTPPSAWFWETIPLLGYTQFPWRTLGLASLLLALLAALGARLLWASLAGGRRSVAIIGVITSAMMLYALPWTYTLYRADIDPNDSRDLQRFEREGGQLALSSYAEYLPVSADADQLDANRLLERFQRTDVISRLAPSAALRIVDQEWGGTWTKLSLRSAAAQTLVFDWLYTPGWAAAIDGDEIAVFPSAAGLVALDAPAGEFDLRLALKPTPIQSLAHAASGLGLAGALLLLLLWPRLRSPAGAPIAGVESASRWHLAFAALGIAVFSLKALVVDATETPFMRQRFGGVQEADALANFADAIDLLALEAPRGEISSPTSTFKLYWRRRDLPLERDYASVIRMRDPQGLVVAEASSFMPGGIATSNWLPGAYIEDRIALTAPPFTPRLPSPYRFDLSLYDVESLRELSVMNADGNPADVSFEIARLPLRWDVPPPPTPLDPLHAADDDDLAQLHGVSALPTEATAGDSLRFSWVWRKLRDSPADLFARVIWLAADGAEAASEALPLVKGYDFGDWLAGETNRGHHRLIVPPALPAGDYRLGLRLLDASGLAIATRIELDQTMRLTVPRRDFEAPQYDIEARAEWHNGIILHGYSARANGEIELVWGANRPLNESLRLFVHALDADGAIAAQWDGVPVDWTRPTTGWIPGEYVTTRHSFALPAGEYRLRVGWYAAATGKRIGVGAADALELQASLVIE